jgi:hypothetical protein
MQRKTLIAAAIAAAFAFPLTATAANDKATTGAKSASANSANEGSAAGMFTSLDKNGDGFISKDEAMGSAHHANFDKLDKNGDGKLSKAEHAAAQGDARSSARSASGSSVSTNQSASTQPGTATPPGTSPTMPNSPPPAGNTQGTGNKVQ